MTAGESGISSSLGARRTSALRRFSGKHSRKLLTSNAQRHQNSLARLTWPGGTAICHRRSAVRTLGYYRDLVSEHEKRGKTRDNTESVSISSLTSRQQKDPQGRISDGTRSRSYSIEPSASSCDTVAG